MRMPPPDMSVERAAEVLSGIPEYAWLVESDQPWWKAAEVAKHAGVTADVVRSWCDSGKIQGAMLYAQQVGWRMPRSGLLLFFAGIVNRGGRLVDE